MTDRSDGFKIYLRAGVDSYSETIGEQILMIIIIIVVVEIIGRINHQIRKQLR